MPPHDVDPGLLEALQRAVGLALFLDYDGTLVSFVDRPEWAEPDPEIRGLLARLSRAEHCIVHIVSGRDRSSLERWLGDLPLGLHAEHGLWSRPAGGSWEPLSVLDVGWLPQASELMNRSAADLPGAFVEARTASLVFHYRLAPQPAGTDAADALWQALAAFERTWPVQRLRASMAIELRCRDVHKGSIVRELLRSVPPAYTALAIGDDPTDEDMFEALAGRGLAIHVGKGPSCAGYRLADPQAVRDLLGIALGSSALGAGDFSRTRRP